jgi:hypothetical protein
MTPGIKGGREWAERSSPLFFMSQLCVCAAEALHACGRLSPMQIRVSATCREHRTITPTPCA